MPYPDDHPRADPSKAMAEWKRVRLQIVFQSTTRR